MRAIQNRARPALPTSNAYDVSETRVSKTIRAGTNGAKRFFAQYGDTLVCVRYRDDDVHRQRLTTIEVVVEQRDLPTKNPVVQKSHRRNATRIDLVAIELRKSEWDLWRQVRAAGARWDPEQLLWRMPRSTAVELGLSDRILEGA